MTAMGGVILLVLASLGICHSMLPSSENLLLLPGTFESACQSDDDFGWSRFQSSAELNQSNWSLYFLAQYDALPPDSDYPVCTFDFWLINKTSYDRANISDHMLVPWVQHDDPLIPPNRLNIGDLYKIDSHY